MNLMDLMELMELMEFLKHFIQERRSFIRFYLNDKLLNVDCLKGLLTVGCCKPDH